MTGREDCVRTYTPIADSPNWSPMERGFVQSEEKRAFGSTCPKCGAQPGDYCQPDLGTMHYERWGYGSLSTDQVIPARNEATR